MARSGPRLTQSQFLQCLFEITLIDVLFRIRQRAFYIFLLGVNIHHRFEPFDFGLKLRMPCLVGQVIIESFRRQFGAKLKLAEPSNSSAEKSSISASRPSPPRCGHLPIRPRGTEPLLLINLIDEAAFIQLAHDAFVDHVLEAKLYAGLAAGRFFDLYLHAGPGHQRHHVIEFGGRGVG